MNLDHYRTWIGHTETRTEIAAAAPVAALSATLDRDDPPAGEGSLVPPLWQWLYFTPRAPASHIGPDGHEQRGGFLPPVALPRRMFAGGRFEFLRPLRVGDTLTRSSRIADVSGKQGRSGSLVFVTVHHEIAGKDGEVALREEHDIVYRDPPAPGTPTPAPEAAPEASEFSREIAPDPVLLFRYSALTFNGHRIHYDRNYATREEGYPGLVVHGPLIATLLLDLLRREAPEAEVHRFQFRAKRPLFDIHRFTVCGRRDASDGFALWACDHEGRLAMQAHAETRTSHSDNRHS
jgi:3-methylfumaryl-CoA hydratase